jgi:hypothetical protein
MTISTILTALQTFNATITGVTSAPAEVPGSLNSADLPTAISVVGAGEWLNSALGDTQEIRAYRVLVFVKPIVQGSGPDTSYQATVTLIEAFKAAYLANRVAGSTAIEDIPEMGDNGVEVLRFGDLDYRGFTVTLRIIEA